MCLTSIYKLAAASLDLLSEIITTTATPHPQCMADMDQAMGMVEESRSCHRLVFQ